MDNTIKCFQIAITGKLRGRGLRFSAKYIAYPLHVKGFVEYLQDDGILIEAEGEEEQLENFVAWLRNFIKSWKVSDLHIVETAPKGYSSFEIRNSPWGEDTPTYKSSAIKYLSSFSRKIRQMVGSDKNRNLKNK